MKTVNDAEDSYLGGRARFETWRAQFESQWYGPMEQSLLMAMWAQMTPAQRQQVQQQGLFAGGSNGSTIQTPNG